MQDEMLEKIIRDVLSSMKIDQTDNAKEEKHDEEKCCNEESSNITYKDYPLAKNRKDLIKTSTGKTFDDITLEAVLNNEVKPDDIRITAQTLLYQAQVADSVGRKQFARNLRRAAELTKVPDDRVLEIYNALRPRRSTKEELLSIAEELDKKYGAKMNAELVREAADVYERRGILKA